MALKSNISKLMVINFLTGMVFWYAIEKLFMQHIGITPVQMGINVAVLIIIILLFDVPSGILADKWNRKYTLILGLISLTVSTMLCGISNGYFIYMVGTIFYGFYVVFTSGTFQAIMYDSLHELGKQKHYDKYQGISYALFLAGVGISSVSSGYIYSGLGPRWPYYLSVVTSLMTLAVLILLKEPKFHKPKSDDKLLKHVKDSTKLVMQNKLIFHLAFFMTIAAILSNSVDDFIGLYFIALGVSAIAMGYLSSVASFSHALGQLIAPKIGRKILKYIPMLFIIFSIFSFLENTWGLIFVYISLLLYATLSNQAEAEIQDNMPSYLRATTISLISFIKNLILIPISIAFGWLVVAKDVFTAFQMIAVIGIAYLVIWALISRKYIKKAYI